MRLTKKTQAAQRAELGGNSVTNGIPCLPAPLVPVALSRQVPQMPQLSLVRPGEIAAVTAMCVQATRPAKPMITAQGSEPLPKEVTGPLESIFPGPLLLRVKIRRWYDSTPRGRGQHLGVLCPGCRRRGFTRNNQRKEDIFLTPGNSPRSC